MKTCKINLYSFNELSDAAKSKAIEDYRKGNDYSFMYDEAHETVKKFNDVFNLNEGRNSWLDYSDNFEDNVLILTGQRLRTYILNNFGNSLYKGKYYSLWSKTEKSYKYYKDGYPVLKSKHSKILLENCCVLTGVCYDDDILQPIYNFIDKPDTSNLTDLINDCFYSLKNSLEREEDCRNTDDYISEEIEANEMQFTEDGKKY